MGASRADGTTSWNLSERSFRGRAELRPTGFWPLRHRFPAARQMLSRLHRMRRLSIVSYLYKSPRSLAGRVSFAKRSAAQVKDSCP